MNKVPTVIKRKLILDLQELSLWNEDIKERIIQNKSIKNETVPDWLKEKYQTEEACIDFDDMKKREKENIFLEETLVKMKKHYKNEKDFLKLITRTEKDLAMRTALKVMMRYQKLLPKSVDEAKLDSEIEKRMPGKKRSDFKQDAIDKFIIKMNLYKKSDDPMLLLGDRPTRERLIEESNTIQYNGILRLINYFMLLEDITNFVNENNYLRGFGRGCLSKDTEVLVKNKGFIKIADVMIGDYVWTHKNRWRRVLDTFKYEINENDPCLTISMSNEKISLTSDHKIYIKQKNETNFSFKQARLASKGDILLINQPTNNKSKYLEQIILDIEHTTLKTVHDLFIDGDNSFLTKACVVHNSGAGSIVAYALDITDCQPIENGLLFERFLTTERIGEKDVELDGFSWKEFLSRKNQSRIEISQEDLILTDDEMDDQSIDDMIDGDME